jgi:hypothetical protein
LALRNAKTTNFIRCSCLPEVLIVCSIIASSPTPVIDIALNLSSILLFEKLEKVSVKRNITSEQNKMNKNSTPRSIRNFVEKIADSIKIVPALPANWQRAGLCITVQHCNLFQKKPVSISISLPFYVANSWSIKIQSIYFLNFLHRRQPQLSFQPVITNQF